VFVSAYRKSSQRRIPLAKCFLLVAFLIFNSRHGALAKAQDQHATPPASRSTALSDADAARLVDNLSQALEAGNQRKFLKLFDPARTSDFPVLRDQMAAFFARYDGFRIHYHITQVSMQGEFGVILVDFQLGLIAPGAADVTARKEAQLRLAAYWDGKQWKLVDIAPRNFFT
jgi:hypothetical protein